MFISNIIRKHYVTFFSPGTFFSEQSTKDIESWDTTKAVEMAEKISERYNAKPYGFCFKTFKTLESIRDGNEEFEVKPKLEKTSGTYYLGGTLKTYEQVLQEDKKENEILLSNMRCNDWWVVIVNTNSFVFTKEFDENDFIVGPSGKIVEAGNSPHWKQVREEMKEK